MKEGLSTEPYKGTRDFYPEDMFLLNYVFGGMRKVAERFGYLEYGASPLEPSELYRAKSGEEIVNEQTYTFTDRGGREVTLRPEMTPSVARMVAGRRRELTFPLRWYSIPNLFRYEQPQRGRLREHFQLNADIFGLKETEAEIEIISLAAEIMKNFGAAEKDFLILINHRGLMNALMTELGFEEENARAIFKLLDRKNKMEAKEWEERLRELALDKTETLSSILQTKDLAQFVSLLPQGLSVHQGLLALEKVLLGLSSAGIRNVHFSPALMRGFDYYTGVVFEVFDTNPKNRRSLFGGGRYDDLVSIFGKEPVPTVGFGMGDVTMLDFLQTHKLLPTYAPPTKLYLCRAQGAGNDFVIALATELRQAGVNVSVDWSGRPLGKQIETADRQHIPFVLCLGEREFSSNTFSLKELSTGKETSLSRAELLHFF